MLIEIPDASPKPHSDFEFGFDKASPSLGDSHRHIKFAVVEEKTISPERPARINLMRRASQYPFEDEELKRERLEQMRKNYIRRQSIKLISHTQGNFSLNAEDPKKMRNTISNFNFHNDSDSQLGETLNGVGNNS